MTLYLWYNWSNNLAQNVIYISRPPVPVYQTIIEKTRGLSLRTQALGAAVARSGQTQQAVQQTPLSAVPVVS
jgi:translation initiation factor 3 subunit E